MTVRRAHHACLTVTLLNHVLQGKGMRGLVSRWIFALIQFVPLSVFASYAYQFGPPPPERWAEALKLGALVAIVQLLIVSVVPRPVNRLLLGANLYLLVGGLAALTRQWWFLQSVYGGLREAGVLVFMVLVGVATTFFTQAGFVGEQGAQSNQVRRYSLYLLFAGSLALSVSVFFQGQIFWAAVLPISGLAALQHLLAHRLRSAEGRSNV